MNDSLFDIYKVIKGERILLKEDIKGFVERKSSSQYTGEGKRTFDYRDDIYLTIKNPLCLTNENLLEVGQSNEIEIHRKKNKGYESDDWFTKLGFDDELISQGTYVFETQRRPGQEKQNNDTVVTINNNT